VHGPGTDDPLMATNKPTSGSGFSLYYYLTDGAGRQLAFTDGTGYNKTSQTVYTTDGGNQSGAVEDSYGFNAGRAELSSLLDLSYFRARFYDERTATWITQDPIGERGGVNLWMFAGNNPANNTDLSGLTCAFWEASCGGGDMGGAMAGWGTVVFTGGYPGQNSGPGFAPRPGPNGGVVVYDRNRDGDLDYVSAGWLGLGNLFGRPPADKMVFYADGGPCKTTVAWIMWTCSLGHLMVKPFEGDTNVHEVPESEIMPVLNGSRYGEYLDELFKGLRILRILNELNIIWTPTMECMIRSCVQGPGTA
jgi:RHS repeat-associated protein